MRKPPLKACYRFLKAVCHSYGVPKDDQEVSGVSRDRYRQYAIARVSSSEITGATYVVSFTNTRWVQCLLRDYFDTSLVTNCRVGPFRLVE